MNDKIKEIAQKARIKDHWSVDEGRYLTNYFDEQKFAELIIQEICTLIKPDEEWRRDASWGYLGGEEGVELLDGAISTIKGHFGVKS
jgi:hypothetical protein